MYQLYNRSYTVRSKTVMLFLISFILFQSFELSQAQSKYILRDYFVYKKVATVVGFSCGDIENDFQTIKILNDLGISATIKRPTLEFNVSSFLNTSYWRLGVFLDLRCPEQNAIDVFYQSSKYRMYDYLYNWLILTTNMSYGLQMLNDSAFSVTTDVVISVPKYDYYDLYDVYNPCKYRGGTLNITKFGTWNENDGLIVTLLEEKILRRRNLHGLKINIAGMIFSKPNDVSMLDYLENDPNKHRDIWSKFGYSQIILLGEIFNFTVNIVALGPWEESDINGPQMTYLNENTIEFGIYPSVITEQRLELAQLIIQAFPVRTCYMFLTTTSSNIHTGIILRPLALESWYTIGLFIIICILILALILKLECVDNLDYGISLLITIGALCQQGTGSFPNQSASRIAFLQITVFGLLIYNYYSAAIVSVRLNEPIDKMNDSLYSLVNSGIKLGVTKPTSVYDFFLRKPSAPDLKYLKSHWDKVSDTKPLWEAEEGIQRIMRGGFALHIDTNIGYPIINKYFDNQMICQLTEVHVLHPSEIGLWTSNNAQFLEVARIGLIKISTTGIRRRAIKRYTVKAPYCDRGGLSINSVTIYETAPIILILLYGMTLSIIICLIENIVFYTLQSKKLNKIVRYVRVNLR